MVEKIQGAAQSPCGGYVAVVYSSNQLYRIPMENGLPGSREISVLNRRNSREGDLVAVGMPDAGTIYTFWISDGTKLNLSTWTHNQASKQEDLRSQYDEVLSGG